MELPENQGHKSLACFHAQKTTFSQARAFFGVKDFSFTFIFPNINLLLPSVPRTPGANHFYPSRLGFFKCILDFPNGRGQNFSVFLFHKTPIVPPEPPAGTHAIIVTLLVLTQIQT